MYNPQKYLLKTTTCLKKVKNIGFGKDLAIKNVKQLKLLFPPKKPTDILSVGFFLH
jgi:hypothetical protein